MPYYVVRQGRIPGIYETWFIEKFFSLISDHYFFVFKGRNAVNKFIDFLEVRINYSGNLIMMICILAEYKKFNTHSDAQDYLDGKIKLQKIVQTKSPISKSKPTTNISVNLMKDTIQKFSATKITSSYEKLTLTDASNNDHGKKK